jgi:deoxyribonuclease-4
MSIKLGPAGTSGLGYNKGLEKCKELGLKALEVEFTHSVHMKNDEAIRIGNIAKKKKIELSVHAPYYINLASAEKSKIYASKSRILQSCERAHFLNARYVVFHSGYYGKRTKEESYELIEEQILDMQKIIKEKRWNVILCPEVTGKVSQFGDIDELLQLAKKTKCFFCVDFAHLRAKYNGKIDYDEIFNKLVKFRYIHSHFSGIEWSDKGERRHVVTPSTEIKELLSQILKRKIDITIINESPDPFGDSVKTKKILDRMR